MIFNLNNTRDLTELVTLEGNEEFAYVVNEWEAKLVVSYLVHQKFNFCMDYYDEPRISRRYDFNTVEGYIFS